MAELIVRPAVNRGRGLGYRLLSWADEQVVAAGRRFLRLDCLAENSSLCAYYRAVGFEHQGDVDGERPDARNKGGGSPGP